MTVASIYRGRPYALRVETARRQSETDPLAAGKTLIEVQRLLGDEQRELGVLIGQLRPEPSALPGSAPTLAARLKALGERIEGEWDCGWN